MPEPLHTRRAALCVCPRAVASPSCPLHWAKATPPLMPLPYRLEWANWR